MQDFVFKIVNLLQSLPPDPRGGRGDTSCIYPVTLAQCSCPSASPDGYGPGLGGTRMSHPTFRLNIQSSELIH